MVMSSKKIGSMVESDVQKDLAGIGSMRPNMSGDDEEFKAAVAPKKAQTFAEAFKAARAEKGAGKTFTWGGKSYSTNMAGEGAKRSAPSKPTTSTAAKPTVSTTAATPAPARRETPKTDAKVDTRFTGKMGAINPRVMEKPKEKPAPSQSQRFNARAAELSREAQKEARAEKAKGSEGARARLKNLFGFGSAAAERAAKGYTRAAESAGRQERALANKPKQKLLLTGEEARKANKGTIGGKAKGGSVRPIDGCAVRGKTRAKMK